MVISTRSKSRGAAPPAPPPAAAPIAKKSARSMAAAPAKPAAKAAVKAAAKPVVKTAADAAPPRLLPDVTLARDDGSRVAVRTLLSDATPGLLLFTYPRANTGGCTAQATGLSALAADFAAAGYALAGASYDSPKSQAGWKAKHDLQCTLLCDTLDAGLLKALRAHKAPKGVKRSLFVVRRGGEAGADGDDPVIVQAHVTVSPKDSIALAKQYVADHPCKGPAAAENGAGDKKKPDAEMDAAAPADPDEEKKDDAEKKEEQNGDAAAKAAEDGEKRQTGDEKKDAN